MRAIIVCVDYWDYLELTLQRNVHHFQEVHVITSSRDTKTQELVSLLGMTMPLTCWVTDLFYEEGAVFNKWKALEWGLDQIGREGWLCLLDADIVLPPLEIWQTLSLDVGELYTPRRRMMQNMSRDIPHYSTWSQHYPLHRNEQEFAGYCQIFHANDPALPSSPPWHDVRWITAGGADSFFQAMWKKENKIRPPFECLHLGEAGRNWCGRATAFIDGSIPKDAQARRDKLSELMRKRGTGPTRFFYERGE